jgi:hypothetical protein
LRGEGKRKIQGERERKVLKLLLFENTLVSIL